MSREQLADFDSNEERFSFRRPFLMVAFAGLGCWGLTVLALAGGYYAGDVVVTWLSEPSSSLAYSGPEDGVPTEADLEASAEGLSRISPAAGTE